VRKGPPDKVAANTHSCRDECTHTLARTHSHAHRGTPHTPHTQHRHGQERRTRRQTDRQTDRHTDRQAHRQTCLIKVVVRVLSQDDHTHGRTRRQVEGSVHLMGGGKHGVTAAYLTHPPTTNTQAMPRPQSHLNARSYDKPWTRTHTHTATTTRRTPCVRRPQTSGAWKSTAC